MNTEFRVGSSPTTGTTVYSVSNIGNAGFRDFKRLAEMRSLKIFCVLYRLLYNGLRVFTADYYEITMATFSFRILPLPAFRTLQRKGLLLIL